MSMKKFKFRTDSNNRIAIKEVASKVKKGEDTRLSVLIGLTDALLLTDVSIFKDNICVDVKDLVDDYTKIGEYMRKLKLSSTPIYYALDNLTYLCVIRITLKGNNVRKKSLSLFCPSSWDMDTRELECKSVTSAFPQHIRNALADSIFEYALFRGL